MSLVDRTRLGARFKSGSSALGHRWLLLDEDEQEIGRTKRAYGGGAIKRGLWRTVTATGLDKGDDIKAVVFDGDGTEVARVWSQSDEKIVHLQSPSGEELGRWARDKETGVTLSDAGGTVVGRIATDKDDAWEITDTSGATIGLLTRGNIAQRVTFSLIDLALYGQKVAFQASDFDATKHRGFANSDEYWVALDEERRLSEALRRLVVLAPVLAGYAY